MSRIGDIVREALGPWACPSGVTPFQSFSMDVEQKPVPLPSIFGPVVAPSSGPTVSEMIVYEVPGDKETCKCFPIA